MDLDKLVDKLITDKMKINKNFIKITFFELRVKYNLDESATDDVIEMITERLQEHYKIYYTKSKYKINGEEKVVEDNILMIAIKEI